MAIANALLKGLKKNSASIMSGYPEQIPTMCHYVNMES